MIKLNNLDKGGHTEIPSVTMLRGLASLGVCFMHFTGTVESTSLKRIGEYGGWGVPIFFMLSGFIIPYALFTSSYKISNYFSFLLKRIVRLDPPYLLTIIGIFALSFLAQLSPYHTADVIEVFTKNNLYHLFYLVEIFNGKWLIVVFWTLAIEFQFYLLIGLLFPLFTLNNSFIRSFTFISLCAIPFVFNDDRFVTNYLLAFLPGMLLFCYLTKKIDLPTFVITLGITLVLNYLKSGLEGVACPLLATGFILFVKQPIKPLVFLGTISYSLYLIHTPIGSDGIINFMQHFIHSQTGRIWLMFLTIPVVIFFSWIFYRVIEKPSKDLTKKIRY